MRICKYAYAGMYIRALSALVFFVETGQDSCFDDKPLLQKSTSSAVASVSSQWNLTVFNDDAIEHSKLVVKTQAAGQAAAS